VHKVAPALATNNRVVLKPSEKRRCRVCARRLLYEAGLPPQMLSVIHPAIRAKSPTSC